MALEFLKITDENAVRVSAEDVHRQVSVILQAVNVPEEHAEITAKILTKASLFAVDSHGVGNVCARCRARVY